MTNPYPIVFALGIGILALSMWEESPSQPSQMDICRSQGNAVSTCEAMLERQEEYNANERKRIAQEQSKDVSSGKSDDRSLSISIIPSPLSIPLGDSGFHISID